MERRRLLLAALSLGATAFPTLAQQDPDPFVDTVAQGKGRINYAAGVVKATGYGAPPTRTQNPAQARLMALGAAKADALRNLAMAVSSVQVTATTKVKNYVTESDVIETRVTAILQNARIVAESVGKDGLATVVVEIPLYGKESVAAAVLPETVETEPSQPKEPEPVRPAPRKPRPAPRGSGLAPTPMSDKGPFTSVIIDCRGLGINAVMSPKVYDTTGRELYGTMEIDMDYAIEVGIVGYPRSVSEALGGKRAGKKPLILQALQALDAHRIDVVLSVEDGERLRAADARTGFLKECRVIFLCDPVR